MDHKTRPSKVYTSVLINISYENNEGFDDTSNGQKKWGEDGPITQLMNITSTLQELETLKAEHEQSNVKYYVEEFRSPTVAYANG
jgi:hypothetical protein